MNRSVRLALAILGVTAALFTPYKLALAGDTIKLGFIADATGVGESYCPKLKERA